MRNMLASRLIAVSTAGLLLPVAALADDRESCKQAPSTYGEELTASIAACSALIDRDRNDADAYRNRASGFISLEDYDKASDDVDTAIAIDNTSARAYRMRSLVRQFRGEFEEALSDLTHASELEPQSTEYPWAMARMLGVAGKYDEAAEQASKAIALAPSVEGYAERAGYYRYANRTEEALADYDKAIELTPQAIEQSSLKADYLFQLGRPDEAFAVYTKVIEANPGIADAYLARALAYATAGRKDEALADYAKVIEIHPNKGYRLRGEHFERAEQYDLAVADYSKLIELEPESGEPYFRRAGAYRAMKNTQAANEDLGKAIALEPGATHYYANRISLNRESEGEDAARLVLADYDKLVEIDPKTYYVERGDYLRGRKDYLAAIADYSKAIAAGDTSKQLYEKRVAIYRDMGDFIAAADSLSVMIENEPDTIALIAARGYANLRAGRVAAAVSDYVRTLGRIVKLMFASAEDLGKDSLYAARRSRRSRVLNAGRHRAAFLRKRQFFADALADPTKSISLDGLAGTYEARAALYVQMGSFEAAVDDFSKLIELQPDTIAVYGARVTPTSGQDGSRQLRSTMQCCSPVS